MTPQRELLETVDYEIRVLRVVNVAPVFSDLECTTHMLILKYDRFRVCRHLK